MRSSDHKVRNTEAYGNISDMRVPIPELAMDARASATANATGVTMSALSLRDARNILVCLRYGIGDVLMQLPVLEALRHPNTHNSRGLVRRIIWLRPFLRQRGI